MTDETKPLHLCVVMSDSYFPIYYNIFKRTLPAEFDSVNILHVRGHDSAPGLVGEHNFKVINCKKLEFIFEQLKAHQGDNLLVLDLDIIFFKEFKDEINFLLEKNDMLFQHNPHYDSVPYCVGVWALQCSQKNINFFEKQILPRSKTLLLTGEECVQVAKYAWEDPDKWLDVYKNFVHTLNGKQEIYSGDQCVVNSAILESSMGKDIKVVLLPDTYTQDASGGKDPKNCVLYHATGVEQDIVNKATHLVNAHERIMKLK